MTTAELISEFDSLTITNSEDYAQLDYLTALTTRLLQNHDGQLACGALLGVLARHPQVDFGTPGPLVHTLESYRGHYEPLLLASLDSRPTFTTVWLLNRLLNAARGAARRELLGQLRRLQTHPLADAQATAAAESFYHFQTRAG
ncbi:MAG: hypothetical protein ACRYFK_04500 [Janthinobacterium lividum]